MFDETWLRVNNCSLEAMYRRPKFLEILLEIRQEMAHEADYDVELFAEMARSGSKAPNLKGKQYDPVASDEETDDAVVPQLSDLVNPRR